MTDPEARPPKRRLHLTIDLHADDWSALEDALASIEQSVLIDDATNVTSGGSDAGWHFQLTDNPDMTPKRYRDELNAWLEARRLAAGVNR